MPSTSYRAAREAKQIRAFAAAGTDPSGSARSRYGEPAGLNGRAPGRFSTQDDDSPVR